MFDWFHVVSNSPDSGGGGCVAVVLVGRRCPVKLSNADDSFLLHAAGGYVTLMRTLQSGFTPEPRQINDGMGLGPSCDSTGTSFFIVCSVAKLSTDAFQGMNYFLLGMDIKFYLSYLWSTDAG
jgi:hypothetical protein